RLVPEDVRVVRPAVFEPMALGEPEQLEHALIGRVWQNGDAEAEHGSSAGRVVGGEHNAVRLLGFDGRARRVCVPVGRSAPTRRRQSALAKMLFRLPEAARVIANPSPEELQQLTARMPSARWTKYGNLNVQTNVLARSTPSTFIVTDDPDPGVS